DEPSARSARRAHEPAAWTPMRPTTPLRCGAGVLHGRGTTRLHHVRPLLNNGVRPGLTSTRLGAFAMAGPGSRVGQANEGGWSEQRSSLRLTDSSSSLNAMFPNRVSP